MRAVDLLQSLPVVEGEGIGCIATRSGFSHAAYMSRIANIYQNNPRQMPFDFSDIIATLHDDNFKVLGVQKCHRL